MPRELNLTGPHWQFAVSVYGQPGVAESCLELQDRYSVDVNVLLLALFAARVHGAALDDRELAEANSAVAAWREEVVTPLRSIRRRLKTGPAPAPNALTEALRIAVKNVELRAEQIELAVLASWAERLTIDRCGEAPDPMQVITRVVAYYQGRTDRGGSIGDRPSIDVNTSTIERAVRSFQIK